MIKERIHELAIQAGGIWYGGYVEQANGDSVYTPKKYVGGSDIDLEQFAQLLEKELEAKHFSAGYIQGQSDGTIETVQECIELSEQEEERYLSMSETDLAYSMANYQALVKQRFGVER